MTRSFKVNEVSLLNCCEPLYRATGKDENGWYVTIVGPYQLVIGNTYNLTVELKRE